MPVSGGEVELLELARDLFILLWRERPFDDLEKDVVFLSKGDSVRARRAGWRSSNRTKGNKACLCNKAQA